MYLLVQRFIQIKMHNIIYDHIPSGTHSDVVLISPSPTDLLLSTLIVCIQYILQYDKVQIFSI